jgi:septal ring factor EnvC (AmiA/AmiB activator)
MHGTRSKAAGVRHIIVGAALTIALGAVVATSYPAAQTRAAAARAVSDEPALNAILLELRGLRADLATSNQRQLAAQLLVGRLQMQEQRIAYLDAQRAAGAAKLADASREVKEMQDRLAQLEPVCPRMGTADMRKQCDGEVAGEKSRSARLQATEQQLRLELSGLENGVATEQQRWSEFNDRLDVLERSLTSR